MYGEPVGIIKLDEYCSALWNLAKADSNHFCSEEEEKQQQ